MGSVYLAIHSQLHKRVAVKILPSRPFRNDNYAARFKREIRTAGQLNHHAIVQATDATRLAARRLTASGFVPAIESTPMNAERTRRIAAALLIPISTSDAQQLAKRVLRMSDSVAEKEPNEIVAKL